MRQLRADSTGKLLSIKLQSIMPIAQRLYITMLPTLLQPNFVSCNSINFA